ncbi:hypothetical protein JB92DRAFT_2835139 [Gautieria morchelliformis]|nr:hypothetical protein JB92DRAFT_2835139 [Gautieria morchelliformis]
MTKTREARALLVPVTASFETDADSLLVLSCNVLTMISRDKLLSKQFLPAKIIERYPSCTNRSGQSPSYGGVYDKISVCRDGRGDTNNPLFGAEVFVEPDGDGGGGTIGFDGTL